MFVRRIEGTPILVSGGDGKGESGAFHVVVALFFSSTLGAKLDVDR